MDRHIPTHEPQPGADDHRVFVFRRRHRLSHKREFERAYTEGVRRVNGPLAVYGVRNGLGHSRLGVSVGKRIGNAVRRSRVKRMLRESFRLLRVEMPAGYDLVVSVRPHRPLPLEKYTSAIRECWKSIDREHARRERSPS